MLATIFCTSHLVIYPLVLVVLTGCTIAVRAPKAAFNIIGSAEQDGYDVDYAFNSSIVHLPGMTWSISGSYIPLQPPAFTNNGGGLRYSYTYNGEQTFQLQVDEASSCIASEKAEQQLTTALTDTLHGVGGLPSKGKATLKLVGPVKPVFRYAVGASWGRAFRLDYKSPCFKNQGDTSLWYAAMLAIHESTHSALKLAKRQPRSIDQQEDLAIGAESCLFLAIGDGQPGFSRSHGQLVSRLSEALQLQGRPIRVHDLCERWQSYIRRVNGLTSGR